MKNCVLFLIFLIAPVLCFADSELTVGGKTAQAHLINVGGTLMTPRPYLVITGDSVVGTDAGGQTVVTIPNGGASIVQAGTGINWSDLYNIPTQTINWNSSIFQNLGINWSNFKDIGQQTVNWYDINLTLNQSNIIRVYTVDQTTTVGQICHLTSDGNMTLAESNNQADAIGLLGIATANISNGTSGIFLLYGDYTTSGLTTGAEYFLSVSSAGSMTIVRPSASGNIVRILGHAMTTTDFYFHPSNDYVQI